MLWEPFLVTLTLPSICCHHEQGGALGLVKRPGARAVPPPLQWYTGAGEARWLCDCATVPSDGESFKTELCGVHPRELFKNLPHLTVPFPHVGWLIVSLFLCVCLSFLGFDSAQREVVCGRCCAPRDSAYCRKCQRHWNVVVCVTKAACDGRHGTFFRAGQVQCARLVLARHRFIAANGSRGSVIQKWHLCKGCHHWYFRKKIGLFLGTCD